MCRDATRTCTGWAPQSSAGDKGRIETAGVGIDALDQEHGHSPDWGLEDDGTEVDRSRIAVWVDVPRVMSKRIGLYRGHYRIGSSTCHVSLRPQLGPSEVS